MLRQVSGSLTRQGNSGESDVKLDRAVPQVLGQVALDWADTQTDELLAGRSGAYTAMWTVPSDSLR